jgi:branched-chain amino acid transport system ATP-binding protein
MTAEILVVDNLTKRFGGLTANANISFSVREGEIIGLIGPNGAGKSTLFNCISCFYNADGGRIVFRGQEITRKDPETICRMGIGRTFQIVRIFKDMNVLENIMIGAFLRNPRRKDARVRSEEVAGIFRFTDKLYANAASLTISEQKRLEVARVFATGPEIMLLDEMMAGLNVNEIGESVELVLRLKDMGVTVILVEHVMEGIMPIANRVVVLDYGEKIAEGTPEEVTGNEKVIEAYFGKKYAKRREHKTRLQ